MRNKVLFLTPLSPWPLDRGGVVGTDRLLRALSHTYEVDVWCFQQRSGTVRSPYASTHCQEFNCRTKRRNAWNFAMSAVRGVPLNVYRNSNRSFARAVRSVAAQYPVLVLDHYEMYQYLPLGYSGKTVLVEHNIECDLWERYASIIASPVLKIAVRCEAERIRRYERAALQTVSVTICLSAEDARRAKQLAGDVAVYAVPLIGDVSLLRRPSLSFVRTAPVILYVGTLTWEPNIDGLCAFLERAWNRVLRDVPQAHLRIVGKTPDRRIVSVAARHHNVHLLGYLTPEELEAEYAAARAVIAPLRFGGGVKVKVVNAMMRGIPIVATPVAMEGIASAEEYAGVAHGIDDMPRVLGNVLLDEHLWQSLSEQGRSLAEQRFGDAAVMSALTPVIRVLST